jgi:hypothetical protein
MNEPKHKVGETGRARAIQSTILTVYIGVILKKYDTLWWRSMCKFEGKTLAIWGTLYAYTWAIISPLFCNMGKPHKILVLLEKEDGVSVLRMIDAVRGRTSPHLSWLFLKTELSFLYIS